MDFSGFFIAFSMYRRDAPPETTHETLMRMVRMGRLPQGTLVTADAYFGGVDGLRALAGAGCHALLSCNVQRPCALFRDGVCRDLHADGDSRTVYGTVPGPDREEVPFLANSFLSKGRKINTMSTVYSDRPVEATVVTMVNDETEEVQSRREEVNELRPEVRMQYQHVMDFVDNADQALHEALLIHRTRSWSTAVMRWVFVMLLSVNARKLHQSATGELLDVSVGKWCTYVYRVLVGKDTDGTHPDSVLPERVPGRPNRIGKCKACASVLQRKRPHDTAWRCPMCGPICKECQGSGTHGKYAAILKKPSRRFYERTSDDTRACGECQANGEPCAECLEARAPASSTSASE